MMYRDRRIDIDQLEGAVVKEVHGLEKYSDDVSIVTNKGTFVFYHDQDCCENVALEDFEYMDLTGATILSAKEEESEGSDEWGEEGYIAESYTWTFYRITGTKGELIMRWLGTSNGYYSEAVYMRLENES